MARVHTQVKTVVRYHDVARVHAQVKTVVRYHDVARVHTQVKTVVRYHDVNRVHTQVKTIVRYHDVTRVKHLTAIRTVISHKVIYTHKVRYVTVVRHITRLRILHRTVVVKKVMYHYYSQPRTGSAASPVALWEGPIAPEGTSLSIAHLGIRSAPIWTRSFVANPDGSLSYAIVPAYGVTRFADSAPLGQTGLSVMYGHDDIYGSIFRNLGTLRPGDTVVVAQGARTYRYKINSVNVVAADDVRLLNAAYSQPTLALISCTPYEVDTDRVVVIAQLQ